MQNEVFEGKFKEHWGTMCTISFSILKDMHEAQDVVGDTVLELYRNKTRQIDNVSGYLYRSVIRASYKRLAKRRKEPSASKSGEIEEDIPDVEAISAEEKIIRAEMIEIIYSDIKKLPEMDQKIFIMKYLEGKTFKEIAESVSLSERTVSTHYHNVENRLRLQALKRGLSICIILIVIVLAIVKTII